MKCSQRAFNIGKSLPCSVWPALDMVLVIVGGLLELEVEIFNKRMG